MIRVTNTTDCKAIKIITHYIIDDNVNIDAVGVPLSLFDPGNNWTVEMDIKPLREVRDVFIKIRQEGEERYGKNVEPFMFHQGELFYRDFKTINKHKKQREYTESVCSNIVLQCLLFHWYGEDCWEAFNEKKDRFVKEIILKHHQEMEKRRAEEEVKEELKLQKNREKRERQKQKKREELGKVRTFIRIKRPQPGVEFAGIIKVWDIVS